MANTTEETMQIVEETDFVEVLATNPGRIRFGIPRHPALAAGVIETELREQGLEFTEYDESRTDEHYQYTIWTS